MLTFINFADECKSTGKTPNLPSSIRRCLENNPNQELYLVKQDGLLKGALSGPACDKLKKLQHVKVLFNIDLLKREVTILKVDTSNPILAPYWNSFVMMVENGSHIIGEGIDLGSPAGVVHLYGGNECFYDASLCYKRCLELNAEDSDFIDKTLCTGRNKIKGYAEMLAYLE